MSDRFCARGNHMMPKTHFRVVDRARALLARDCERCETELKAQTVRSAAPAPQPVTALKVRTRRRFKRHNFSGVDIDRIHFKLGAVRKKAPA